MPNRQPGRKAVELVLMARALGLDNANNYLEAIIAVSTVDNEGTSKIIAALEKQPNSDPQQLADLRVMLEFGSGLIERVNEICDWIESYGPQFDAMKANVKKRSGFDV